MKHKAAVKMPEVGKDRAKLIDVCKRDVDENIDKVAELVTVVKKVKEGKGRRRRG